MLDLLCGPVMHLVSVKGSYAKRTWYAPDMQGHHVTGCVRWVEVCIQMAVMLILILLVRHLWNGIQSMHDLDIVWDGRVQLPEKGATPTIKHDVYAIMLL